MDKLLVLTVLCMDVSNANCDPLPPTNPLQAQDSSVKGKGRSERFNVSFKSFNDGSHNRGTDLVGVNGGPLLSLKRKKDY